MAGTVAAIPAKEPRCAWRAACTAQRVGGERYLRAGPDSGAGAVFWNEVEQAPHRAVADEVAAALDVIGATAHRCPSDLLAAPSAIRSKEGRGLRVFTPFWRRLVQVLTHPQEPLPAPKTLRPPSDIASDPLESWGLEPSRPDWAGGLRETWAPGEVSAHDRLREFLADDLPGYASHRDRPDRAGTSRLSPHLRLARSARDSSGVPAGLPGLKALPVLATSTNFSAS